MLAPRQNAVGDALFLDIHVIGIQVQKDVVGTDLELGMDCSAATRHRRSEPTGHPVDSEAWIETLETQTARLLKRQKRGPKGNDQRDN